MEVLIDTPQRSTDVDYSYKTSTFKQQGNGQDSWIISYFNEKDEQVFSEIVFNDPSKPDTEISEKFLEGLTEEIIIAIWESLINNMDKLPVELLEKLAAKIPEKKQINPS